jgi:hypothetical protein
MNLTKSSCLPVPKTVNDLARGRRKSPFFFGLFASDLSVSSAESHPRLAFVRPVVFVGRRPGDGGQKGGRGIES